MATQSDQTQVEKTREIAGVPSLADVGSRIAGLSNEAWAETVNDITEWEKIKNKFYAVSNEIPLDYEKKRLGIRNRVRVRLGYLEVNEYGKEVKNQNNNSTSCNVPITGW